MWVLRVTIYIAAVCIVTPSTVGCYSSRNKCDQRNERKKSSETLHENVRMCVVLGGKCEWNEDQIVHLGAAFIPKVISLKF